MRIKRESHTFLTGESNWKSFFKRPKDCFTVTPCLSKAILKEEISAVFHNPKTMYWNGSSLNSSVQKSCAAWLKDGTYISEKRMSEVQEQAGLSSPLKCLKWKTFFPQQCFLNVSLRCDGCAQAGGRIICWPEQIIVLPPITLYFRLEQDYWVQAHFFFFISAYAKILPWLLYHRFFFL